MNASFTQYGSERSFSHLARVAGQGNLATGCRLPPNFVAAGTGAVKGESKGVKLARKIKWGARCAPLGCCCRLLTVDFVPG